MPRSFLKVLLVRHGKIPEVDFNEQHGFSKIPRLIQHLRQACAVAKDMPQPFLPCLIPVKNVLHQIEHAKNVRICFDHNHTAPVIEPIQVPVLPQTDEARLH